MASASPLTGFLEDVLVGGDHFLSGVHKPSTSVAALLSAIVEWGMRTNRGLDEIVAGIEPCVRQSVLLSLLPAKGVDPNYQGSIDAAIDEHINVLNVQLSPDQKRVLRDVCLNVRKYHGLDREAARSITKSIGHLRAQTAMYERVVGRQSGRCLWCGAVLSAPHIVETLDHVAPKHLGNDLWNGANWALACQSCNHGKGDALAWAARADAHDLISRHDLGMPDRIGLPQRWAVLARDGRCRLCGKGVRDVELWVYRRIRTGLPIPANCAAACEVCIAAQHLDVLTPDWHVKESGRRTA